MKLNNEHEVVLSGRKFDDVVADLAELLPSANEIEGAELFLSDDEEYALDELFGMHWSHQIYMRLIKHVGNNVSIGGEIELADRGMVLKFSCEALTTT